MIMPINSQTSIIMWDSEIKSMLNILIIPKIHHDTQSAWNVSNTLKLDTTGIPTSEYQYANKAPLFGYCLPMHKSNRHLGQLDFPPYL